jgi:hypothetical protein
VRVAPAAAVLIAVVSLGTDVSPAAASPGAAGPPAAASLSPASPPAAATSPGTAILPLEEIRAGMEGTARTVFEGNALEEFRVEILGVLRNAIGPQQDLILARLRGDKVEFTGVVSGMSGSPVYVGGRLIGALSYRLGPFAKEAIAGITPIADMLKLVSGETRVGETPAGPGRLAPPEVTSLALPALGAGGLQPIATPLVCSGCDAGVLRHYASVFEAHGLEPTTGGGLTGEGEAMPLVPGSAIGASLVTGDLSITGIGTLTHVDGKRVFAFGHPFLGAGALEMPMTQAQVILTFASSAASFKLANATRPVGSIVQDRLTAIVGEVGRVPPTIPVTVRVDARGARRTFRYDILRHRTWSPVMLGLTTANSLVRTTDFSPADTLALRGRIDAEGYPRLEVDELYSGTNPAQPVHMALANDAAGLLNLISNNPFSEARVLAAEIDVELLPESRLALVTSLRASRNEVRPGETFTVTAGLRPYRGAERQVSWEVALPEDTPPGETQITVGSGPAIDGLDRRVTERQLAQAASLGDLIRLAGRQRKSRAVYLKVTRRSPSAIVRSEVLPDLPLSIFTVFNNPRLSGDSTLMTEAPILEIARDLDLVAVGGRRIAVYVR